MNGPIRRLAAGLFGAMILLVATVTWVQVIRGPEYREDPRNARVIASRMGRERGTIITADGVVVAVSRANPSDPRVFRREYPEAELYAHSVGFSSVLFGDRGIEATYSSELVSDRDSTISGVINAILGGDLRPRGLRLSLIHDLQEIAAESLGDRKGAVVAMDAQTGAVLAMVSYPSFDPNTVLDVDAGPVGDALEADPDQPLLNRTSQSTYSPGSTFKTVVSAAAVETGIASPATTYPDPVELELPGSTATIRNYSRGTCAGGGSISLAVALAVSCNTTFGMIGMDLGAADLVGQAERFGFNRDPATEFPAVASVIPPVSAFDNDLPALAQTAIGQRDVRATALQMASVAGAIANGGEVVEPYLVAEVFTADGEVASVTEPTLLQRAVSPATASAVAEMMEGVITSGTGTRAAVSGVRIAGKTGTAEVPDSDPHSWFIGFGPVNPEPGERQIAIAVIVESGGGGEDATGGTVAAPIAQRVLAEFFGRS